MFFYDDDLDVVGKPRPKIEDTHGSQIRIYPEDLLPPVVRCQESLVFSLGRQDVSSDSLRPSVRASRDIYDILEQDAAGV